MSAFDSKHLNRQSDAEDLIGLDAIDRSTCLATKINHLITVFDVGLETPFAKRSP